MIQGWYLEMTKQSIKNRQYLLQNQAGSFMAAMLIMILVLTAIGLAVAGVATTQYSHTKRSTFVANAQLVSEAGIEQSVTELNEDSSFTGYTTSQTFFNNNSQGYGVFTTTVTDSPDGKSKIILSTGKVYRSQGDTEPTNIKKIRVTVVGTQSEGYSVYSGPGGLILGGSAAITNSDVYVNGTVTLSGAAGIGTPSQPLHVDVANYACPTSGGPTYPQVCATQPISTAWSTHIYGTVCATNQTSVGPNNNIQPGSSGEGLKLGCIAPQAATPTYDRTTQISKVTTTAAGNSNTYVCNSWPFNRTWPANLKLTGNVSVGGSCNIKISGNTYITGNLDIGGASTITVDDSVGTVRPVVIVDGTINVNGSGQIQANSSGTGIQFISFKSNASCNPNCTALTGSDLKNSQSSQTVNVGGAVNLPGMIFQSYWGKIKIGGSGNIGAAMGQTVDMSGAGTITFGTKLSAGSRTWTISSYQRVY